MINLVELLSGGRPDESIVAWSEDESLRFLHGRLTSCEHANQCEGHAVYCMHDNGPRKCRLLWNDGNIDGECDLFADNKYFNGTLKETFKHLLDKNLAVIEDES